jgi:hypothetical protein
LRTPPGETPITHAHGMPWPTLTTILPGGPGGAPGLEGFWQGAQFDDRRDGRAQLPAVDQAGQFAKLAVRSPLVWPLIMLLTCPLASCPETGRPLFVSTDVANSWAACTTTTSAVEVPAAPTCGLARSRENWPLAWPHR